MRTASQWYLVRSNAARRVVGSVRCSALQTTLPSSSSPHRYQYINMGAPFPLLRHYLTSQRGYIAMVNSFGSCEYDLRSQLADFPSQPQSRHLAYSAPTRIDISVVLYDMSARCWHNFQELGQDEPLGEIACDGDTRRRSVRYDIYLLLFCYG